MSGTRVPVVVADDLSKTYHPYGRMMRLLLRSPVSASVQALTDVSFSLHAGEIAVVLGANGAGKSTLFRILTGLTTPSSGTATIDGHSVQDEAPRVRRVVGFAPAEDRTLLLRHSCRENLVFHGRMQGMYGARLRRRVGETLEAVGLQDKVETAGFALSSGMRARLQIARSLLHEPKVLVLDEPTGAIDPLGARDIIEMVRNVARDHGAAVLLSSHRLEEIEELQERVIVLDRGSVVFQGNLGELRAASSDAVFEVGFSSPQRRERSETLLAANNIRYTAGDARSLVVLCPTAGELVTALGAEAGALVSLDQRRMTLLEVLRSILEDPAGAPT